MGRLWSASAVEGWIDVFQPFDWYFISAYLKYLHDVWLQGMVVSEFKPDRTWEDVIFLIVSVTRKSYGLVVTTLTRGMFAKQFYVSLLNRMQGDALECTNLLYTLAYKAHLHMGIYELPPRFRVNGLRGAH